MGGIILGLNRIFPGREHLREDLTTPRRQKRDDTAVGFSGGMSNRGKGRHANALFSCVHRQGLSRGQSDA